MTTWFPIAFTPPQYENSNGTPYSGAVLKGYSAGTTTNIPMATDFTGGTQVNDVALNANGFPNVSGNVIIPHFSENYKLSLYPTQAAADTDSGAIWTVDNVQVAQNANAERYVNFAVDTGAANAYVVAPNPAISSYDVGDVVSLLPINTNTGASTIIVSGLAATDIKRADSSDVVANDIQSTGFYQLIYNGTDFIIQNPSSPSALVEDTTPQLGGALDTNGHMVQLSKGADIASAAALPLLTDGNFFDVTGTTAITSINTSGVIGTKITLQFDGILTLTYNATDLILPTGADLTTAVGDTAEFIEYASGDWVCTNYNRADGLALAAIKGATTIASGSLPASNLLDITGIPDSFAIIKLTVLAAEMDVTTRFVEVSLDTGLGLGDSNNNQFVMKIDGTTITRNASSTAFPSPDTQSTSEFCSFELKIPAYSGTGIKQYTGRYAKNAAANTFSNDILYDGVLSDSGNLIRTGAIVGIRINTSNVSTNFNGGTYLLEGFN